MKCTVAIVLVVVAMGSAEPPARGGVFARQQSFQPRGVRPAPPLRFQRQQVPPVPAPSYGPPPQVYGPPAEPTTTETPITTTESVEATTTEPQAESFRVSPTSQKLQDNSVNPAGVYVVIPQTQNLIYATAPAASAKLQQPRLLPVQAVPAFARIQELPQIVQYQAVVPVASSAYTSIVNTPYSSTFVQSFQ